MAHGDDDSEEALTWDGQDGCREPCGIDYWDAIADARFIEVNGVMIPFASPSTLWRMKQTVREKDVPDRLFLRQLAQAEGVILDPPPSPPAQTIKIPEWMPGPIRKVLLRWFGCSPSV